MFSHSSNDPSFWLHPANLDRIWYLWQRGDVTGSGLPKQVVNETDLNGRFWAFDEPTVQFDIDLTGGPRATLFDVHSLQGLDLPNIETYKLMETTRPPLCDEYV
ncbi:hypothetical protein V8E36_001620 [Tilletia maclaganii]